VSIPQKILFSFLLSAFLVAGVAALAIIGVFDYGSIVNEPAKIPMLVAFFLTLFLIIFLCFNLRRDSTGETWAPAGVNQEKSAIWKHLTADPFLKSHEYETLEEIVPLEAVGGSGGVSMFKPFTFFPGNPELLQGAEDDETAVEIFYEQNGIHYINSNAFTHDNMEKLDNDFAKLVESVVDKD